MNKLNLYIDRVSSLLAGFSISAFDDTVLVLPSYSTHLNQQNALLYALPFREGGGSGGCPDWSVSHVLRIRALFIRHKKSSDFKAQ